MAQFLLNAFLGALMILVNIITYPISIIIDFLIPSVGDLVNYFNNMVNTYILPNISFFTHLLPPVFKSVLYIILTFLIGFYSIYFTILAIEWVFTIIRKVKFW